MSAVLGIGERVGITPLGGLVACLYAANPEYVKSKYNLPMLREIENLVAEAVEVNVPFMNPITYVPPDTILFGARLMRITSGYCAFTHKAGIHAKAILNNPSTYEILKPEDFGLTRYVSIGSVTILFNLHPHSLTECFLQTSSNRLERRQVSC